MDDSLYKAMVIAKQYRIIETSDSNWDEALTKGEAIQLFLNTYKALVVRDGYSTTSDQGTNEGTAIDRETNTNTDTNSSETSSIGGEDTKTDEEIEAELEEAEVETSDTEVDEMDEYIRSLTNDGKGYDLDGVHYETRGEYLDALDKKLSSIPVEEEPEWWTPDQGPITQ